MGSLRVGRPHGHRPVPERQHRHRSPAGSAGSPMTVARAAAKAASIRSVASRSRRSVVDYLEVSNTLTYRVQAADHAGLRHRPVRRAAGGFRVRGARRRVPRHSATTSIQARQAARSPGFNVQNEAGGTNRFEDIFTEFFFPLVKDAPVAQRPRRDARLSLLDAASSRTSSAARKAKSSTTAHTR